MKPQRIFTLLLCISLLMPAVAVRASEGERTGGMLRLGSAGELQSYRTQAGEIHLTDIRLDAGIDGAYLLNSIGYQRFWDMNTWELARLVPKASPSTRTERAAIYEADGVTEVAWLVDGIELCLRYRPEALGLRVDASITSRRSQVSEVQGILLQVEGLATGGDTSFRFPGNSPFESFEVARLRPFTVRSADYSAPLVRVESPQGAPGLNAVFLHETEKWSAGLWKDREDKLHACFLVMAEGLLQPGERYEIGPLYLQLTSGEGDIFSPVRALYGQMGYGTPAALPDSDGPLYSLHPAGPMDRGMNRPVNMAEFADVIADLHDMGVKTLWLLPVFEHSGRGVYEPADQSVIDPRYGTDEDVKAFARAAHARGMRVLLDYVPHGPRPEDPLAKENPQWCSVHRSGNLQIEWDCVSFDMANEDYQAYTSDLSRSHAERLLVDGGRVDCAMGGLSNWQAPQGRRASASGLHGGLSNLRAIRKGYQEAGKVPLLLPENFHPVPAYAGISDLFYDMPLYRVMYEMRQRSLDETQFAQTLSRWLDEEQRAGVPGQQRLRFLGNHDTVSWTWDKARATQIYGVEKAKALWALFSFIDGVPFLYQGDEYSPIYDPRTLVDLRPFFKELFTARAAHLSSGMSIRYLPQESPLIAFERENGEGKRLVLVNLSGHEQRYPLPAGPIAPLYGSPVIEEGTLVLAPYQCLMLGTSS